MKTLFTTIIALVFSLIAAAQDGNTITVKVNNATNDNGKMVFNLSSKDQFMQPTPLMASTVEIKDGVALATFENVPDGDYAIIALHDLNGNKQMDFDVNRMPTEAYGMSNNPMSYGPPTWGDAKFEVKADKELLIRL